MGRRVGKRVGGGMVGVQALGAEGAEHDETTAHTSVHPYIYPSVHKHRHMHLYLPKYSNPKARLSRTCYPCYVVVSA